MRPSYITEDAVAEREDLAEFGRNQQHRAPPVAFGEKLAVNELGRADIDPARRLFGDQHARLMREFPRDHHLLQIAAGHRTRQGALAGNS